MNELQHFAEWLAMLVPTLLELFSKTDGNAKKSIRVLKKAYEAIDREQAAELERQRAKTKASGKP